jgi:isoleucyl-tRNA synthetase
MYTFAAGSVERRAGQTAMYIIADGLTRLAAPILSFSADELWRYLPGKREDSVHMAEFPSAAALEALANRELVDRWSRLIAVREDVLAEIEPLRKDKRIGSSLQAKVILTAAADELAFLEAHAQELPALFIVSEVELRPAGPATAQRTVTIERAGGIKCERCWRYVAEVSTDPALAGLCDRCQGALAA